MASSQDTGLKKKKNLRTCLGFSVMQLSSFLLPFSTSKDLNAVDEIRIAEK
jgi:hypothetical protein